MAITKGILYGVITKILSNGSICICEPVFIDYWKKEKGYFKAIFEENKIGNKKYIKSFKQIDISIYGSPIYLPASNEKINDGNYYFVIFENNKNIVKNLEDTDFRNISISTVDSEDYCTPISITTSILFPNKFITTFDTISLNDLENYISQKL